MELNRKRPDLLPYHAEFYYFLVTLPGIPGVTPFMRDNLEEICLASEAIIDAVKKEMCLCDSDLNAMAANDYGTGSGTYRRIIRYASAIFKYQGIGSDEKVTHVNYKVNGRDRLPSCVRPVNTCAR
jgi:hypothetical protein